MPSFNYQDMKISVGFSGEFHVQLRSLDKKLSKDEMAALVYPIFDAQEKALKEDAK